MKEYIFSCEETHLSTQCLESTVLRLPTATMPDRIPHGRTRLTRMRSAMARIMSCMPIHGPHSNHIDILERPGCTQLPHLLLAGSRERSGVQKAERVS